MAPKPPIITDLVQKFERNIEEYHNPKYNETQIRIEFVNPFWKALGWDVDNEKGYAMAYRDVIHEDELKVGRTTRAPDYAFRIGGRRIFFLETKKPAIDLKHDPAAAFQLRRYAYSAKLPVSLLTDFEELIVYDCRIKPAITDKPHIGRMMYYTFQEYLEKWEEINGIFSKEAVMQGAFDRFIEDTQGKRPRAEIDRDFLNDLDKWRIELARNIALRNPELTERELNYAVQLTIDRLIFLRMCEDRDIEQYETLMALLNGNQIYLRLVKLYYKADHRYNSGLFHFEERDGPNPDMLTPNLEVDDKILKQIISELYYPISPYEFSVLPVEVLGNAYEQFLGKRITLTEGHRARIEEKPEVRKAGGVYYTPQYIVDYIVKNTVGKLCEGKTPREVSELRILDPACGSGSFLLGAYQYLLDWHVNWYRSEYERMGEVGRSASGVARGTKTRAKKGKRKAEAQAIFQGKGGEWFLTTAEKKRILLNNIYGVDIDANAVEVTKLSLLLKVLEHETSETLNQQLGLWKERALPNLESNIKCGNSLIGTDFYAGKQAGFFNEEEALRINAFDWEREFPEIFAKGGFDAVIGNPPYGFHQIHSDLFKPYFKYKFESSYGSYEHYFLFYERSLRLLKKEGLHGFIVPVTWLTIPSAKSLRKFILSNFSIKQIIWLPELVFKDAQVNTLISIIQKSRQDQVEVEVQIHKDPTLAEENSIRHVFIQQKFIDQDFSINIFEDVSESNLIKKISEISIELGSIAKPCSGYNPYEVGKGEKPGGGPHSKETVENKPYHSNTKKNEDWKPEIIGRNLSRYFIDLSGDRWVRYGPWLAAPRDPNNFKGERILIQEITGGKDRRIIAAYYDEELYYSRDVIPVKIVESEYHGFYLLGLINSKLITWYHHKRNPKAQKGLFPKILVSDIKKLPIRHIEFSDKVSNDLHDQIVLFVKQILELNKKYFSAKDPRTRETLQRQIDATDRQIDQLVYQLYWLTEEEINIIEEKS